MNTPERQPYIKPEIVATFRPDVQFGDFAVKMNRVLWRMGQEVHAEISRESTLADILRYSQSIPEERSRNQYLANVLRCLKDHEFHCHNRSKELLFQIFMTCQLIKTSIEKGNTKDAKRRVGVLSDVIDHLNELVSKLETTPVIAQMDKYQKIITKYQALVNGWRLRINDLIITQPSGPRGTPDSELESDDKVIAAVEGLHAESTTLFALIFTPSNEYASFSE